MHLIIILKNSLFLFFSIKILCSGNLPLVITRKYLYFLKKCSLGIKIWPQIFIRKIIFWLQPDFDPILISILIFFQKNKKITHTHYIQWKTKKSFSDQKCKVKTKLKKNLGRRSRNSISRIQEKNQAVKSANPWTKTN